MRPLSVAMPVLCLCLGLLGGCTRRSRPLAVDSKGREGRIVVEEPNFDMGEMGAYAEQRAYFEVRNIGDKPLDIHHVRVCCGAVVELPKSHIPPGGKQTMTVVFTTEAPGPFVLKLAVLSSDPEHPVSTLWIRGEVKQTVVWEPESFRILPNSNQAPPWLSIRTQDNKLFSITQMASRCQGLDFQVDPNVAATVHRVQPLVEKDALQDLSLPHYGTVTIKTSRSDYPTIRIPFDVLPDHQVKPPQFTLFYMEPEIPIQRTITLITNNSRGTQAKDYAAARITAKRAVVRIFDCLPSDQGSKYVIEMTYPAPASGQTSLIDEIQISLANGE